MVCNSVNIELYQSMGIDSLPSLGEIELIQIIQGLFSYSMALSDDGRARIKYFLEISIKVYGAATSKIITNKQNTSTQLVYILILNHVSDVSCSLANICVCCFLSFICN